MKHIQLISSLLFSLAALFYLTSCSNNDPIIPSQNVIENNVKTGAWKITSFVDSGKDETNHFSGFTFTFGTNNIITSANGSVTYTGTWSISDSNLNDDKPKDLAFNILFNLTNDFESLNEDWQIVSQTSNRIELIHVSGGNGGTDYLTFEKQ